MSEDSVGRPEETVSPLAEIGCGNSEVVFSQRSKLPSGEIKQLKSEELLGNSKEVQILHGTELYRLCVTKNGKLILHK